MSSKDLAVSVRNLSKSYPIAQGAAKHTTAGEALAHRLRNPLQRASTETFWALKDVSFDVQKGEVVGIIGRNGAGKSTLLKVLSQITEPTAGEIRLYGRVGSLLEVGTGFHPELTGRENIYLNGAILGMKKSEIAKQFDAIVDFAEVEKFLDTPVKRYSSGMYVRLAFAVAAHLNPEILIVDEVLAVGDANFQKKCLGKMQDVSRQEGKTVLFVSHNMTAVQQLCGRAILLRGGRLVENGPTQNVLPMYMSDSSNKANGFFDLSDHAARTPNFEPIIQSLKLINHENTQTSFLQAREKLEVEVEIKMTRSIREPRLALAVEDAYGRRIMTYASYFGTAHLPAIDAACKVKCTISKLQLGSGRYLISVSIADKYEGLLDSLDNAAWLEVEWVNSYGNGEPYSPVYGPVLTNSHWEIS